MLPGVPVSNLRLFQLVLKDCQVQDCQLHDTHVARALPCHIRGSIPLRPGSAFSTCSIQGVSTNKVPEPKDDNPGKVSSHQICATYLSCQISSGNQAQS